MGRRNSQNRWQDIPALLQSYFYVCYTRKKVPINPKTGCAASVTAPKTWGTYYEAVELCGCESNALGPGIVLTDQDPVLCIDLDNVISTQDRIAEYAAEIADVFQTYTEISLSGKGLHVFLLVKEAPSFSGGRWAYIDKNHQEHEIEIYYSRRYIALTGNLWRAGKGGVTLGDRTDEFKDFLSQCKPVSVSHSNKGTGHKVNSREMLRLFNELQISLKADIKREYVLCPFHDDNHPSMAIDREHGWYCFGCSRGGGAVALRNLLRNLTDKEAAAVGKRTNIPLEKILVIREQLLSPNRHEKI